MWIAQVFLSLALLAQKQDAKDPFESIRFLIGTWNATAAGSGDIGSYSFERDLKNHVIVRHSSAGDHGDVVYIYTDAPDTTLKAIYFDSEGHTIHYTLTTPTPTSVVFDADMYRLTYEFKGGVMSGKFQVKPPGQAEYRSYLEWSGTAKPGASR